MPVLDPLGPANILLGGPVTLHESTVHQQAALDPATGDVYATQVPQSGRQLPGEPDPVPWDVRGARGDLCISRVSPAGELLEHMYVRGFDHGASLGVEQRDGAVWIWTSYDATERPIGENAHGRLLCRFPWQPAAVLDVGSPSVEAFDPLPDASSLTLALDSEHSQVGVRYVRAGGRRYRIYSYAAFTSGDFEDYAYDYPQTETDLFQSWCLYGRYAYQWHGSATSDTNPLPGNAAFVIVDLFTGRRIRKVAYTGQPDLAHREPEAITVLPAAEGPRLAYSLATDNAPRRMRLYAVAADAGPGLWISADIASDGIAIAASLGDPGTVTGWTITRPDGTVLTSGGPLDEPILALDTMAAPCRDTVYVFTVNRADAPTYRITSEPVTYIPPGGCGGGGDVGPDPGLVGCASAYTARIHWRGGALELPVAAMDQVTEVTWGRTADDISEAVVTLAKCGPCREIEDIHPWVHELTIHRDGEIVWQGPVRRIRDRIGQGTITVEALDIVGWLDRLANTFRVGYTETTADGQGRRRGTIVYVAHNHLRLNLEESSLSVPPDYPGIMDYVVAIEDRLPTIKVEKDGSSDTAVWTEYLGSMFREWASRGLHFTTVGRSLVLRAWPDETTPAQARLSLADLVGEVEVVRDGDQAATYGFATTQQTQNISEGLTVGTGRVGTPYGRLDSIVRVQEDKPTEADLRAAARSDIAGRYPAPMVIQIPQSAQIAPQAPVRMEQLVPGERVDVFDDSSCFVLEQGFALSDMEVTWDGSRERVTVGLIPLDQEVP